MPDTSKIKGDLWEVTIGALEPFHASVSVGGMLLLHHVLSGRTGDDIVATLVQGRRGEIEIEVQENDVAVIRAGLNMTASGDAPDVGTALTPVAVVIADPTVAADANDLRFYAVTFDLRRTSDGKEEARWVLRGTAQRDANGKVWRLGAGA
ncbi:MAG: hypothetical protein BroJett004_07940 [Planctomycetota bacterium]|nr:MAG: hypothetical protein BroJett004_07940 [Planctomycetota bacterium]